MKHIPVLLDEVIDNVKAITAGAGWFLDGTFGRGGHTRQMMAARPEFDYVGMDCDIEAITYGKEHFSEEIKTEKLKLIHDDYLYFEKHFSELLRSKPLIGILLDLGVSSPQLDESRRGFSFYHDGPLDMRMNTSLPTKASDIVNQWDEKSLNDLFYNYGEVRSPFRVTNKILDFRKSKVFSTTRELADLIEKTDGWRKKGHHPATNYFLALRLEVNQELTKLEKILPVMVNSLAPGGRILVITFHSLEDRIVKTEFKKIATAGLGSLVNKKVLQPSWSDKKENPRARSAKLRVFEKTHPMSEKNYKKNDSYFKDKDKNKKRFEA
jgi:16S rRNA (cytosine1402-N4)-methyltransferase